MSASPNASLRTPASASWIFVFVSLTCWPNQSTSLGDGKPVDGWVREETDRILAAYGNPLAQTPHIDALAETGVVFENAYCNSPLCTPSRASMFSGSRTTTNEVWGNGSELTADTPTMMHFLKSAGYRTVCSGKTHFVGPDQLHGFDTRLTTDMYPANFGWSIDWKPAVGYRPGTSVTRLNWAPVLLHLQSSMRMGEDAANSVDEPSWKPTSLVGNHPRNISTPLLINCYQIFLIFIKKTHDENDPTHPNAATIP